MSRNQRRNRRNKSGGSQSATHRSPQRPDTDAPAVAEVVRRSSTETKSSLRTTELVAYAGAVLAVVMTALAVDADRGGDDPFGAEPAIRLITFLTIGYMVARGLAKSGSYENRVERDADPVSSGAVRTFVGDDEITADDRHAVVGRADDEPVDGAPRDDESGDDEPGDGRGSDHRTGDLDLVDTGVPGEDVQHGRTVPHADARP